MSRYGDYETAVPRRRGGYGAYNDGDERPPARSRAPPRDDPYSSIRPLPPRVPASSVYDTYRPPNLHGNTSGGSGRRDEYSRGSGGRDPPREDYRRDEYGRRDPPSRGGGGGGISSAYDTYRPTSSSRDPPSRSRDPPARDPYRTSAGSGRERGGYRDERRDDQYGTVYPRRAPPSNDYGAYDTYRPPTKPSAEYERKLEKYAGVPAVSPRNRRRDDRRPSRRRDDTDSDDESPVRSSRRKRKDKLKKKKSKRRDDTDSEESESEEDSEESSEESSSEEEVRKKKSKSKKSKSKKASKKSKKSKKKSKRDSDSDETSSEEEESEEDDVVNAVARNFNTPLALPAPDPAALGNEAFGFPGANVAGNGTGGNDLMGGEVASTAMVPVNAEEFQNMPGEYPQDMTATSAGTLAGRFPQIGSAMAAPPIGGMGMSMQPGMMGMGGMNGMGGMGMQQPQAGMMGMGMGGQPGMMGGMGMGMGQQPGAMGAMQPGMMGGMQGGAMQPGMMGMGMQQPGMGGGAPDMLTQDFNGMNLNQQ